MNAGLMSGCKYAPGVKVMEMHFKQHQHYTRALAYGFSAAKGKQVLFVSELPKSDRGKVVRDRLKEDWLGRQKVSA